MATRVFRTFNFWVEFLNLDSNEPLAKGQFQTVSGIEASYDVITYREGGDTIIAPQKFPGLVTYSDLSLQRGLIANDYGSGANAFWDWVANKGGIGRTVRKYCQTVTISLLDDDVTTPIVVWEAKDVWPIKYTGPDFDATSSNLAVEKLDLSCRTIERKNVSGSDTMGASYPAPPA